MFQPVSPQTVYLIHKEKERELNRQIELLRIAREQNAGEKRLTVGSGTFTVKNAWLAQAVQWLQVKFFHLAPKTIQPNTREEPCPGVPC